MTLRPRHRRWLIASAVVVVLLGTIAAAGGFKRSDQPLPKVDIGERIELGQFAWTVHAASLVDRDDDGDPYRGKPWRVLLDVTVENISDETDVLSSSLIGVRPRGAVTIPNEPGGGVLHPGLPRRMQVEIAVDEQALGGRVPAETDIWLGASKYDWTNLAQTGPAWSVANWAAMVADVPLRDNRESR